MASIKQEDTFTHAQRQAHRDFNYADYALYAYFKRVLEEKIRAAGPDFAQEVAALDKLQEQVREFCQEAKSGRKAVEAQTPGNEIGRDQTKGQGGALWNIDKRDNGNNRGSGQQGLGTETEQSSLRDKKDESAQKRPRQKNGFNQTLDQSVFHQIVPEESPLQGPPNLKRQNQDFGSSRQAESQNQGRDNLQLGDSLKSLTVDATWWGETFVLTSADCDVMAVDEPTFVGVMRRFNGHKVSSWGEVLRHYERGE